jgi:hypothetical protein
MDFITEVASDGMKAINDAIKVIEKSKKDAYIDRRDACAVVAAGEFLAAAHGRPPAGFPADAVAVAQPLRPDNGLRKRSARAIARVLAASESRDLWEDTAYFDAWRADVEGLLERLK